MKKKLNIALMGSGFMGKAHSNAWLTVNKFFDVDFEPVFKVCFGTDEELTREFAEKWGWQEVSTNWQEVINRPDIDVVDIVTPTYIHKDMAVAAAKAGKHIFCEKPCAVSYEQTKEMAQAAQKAGVVNYLNHNYRRVPAIAFAKQLIEEGKLGTIYHWRGAYLQDWIMDPDFPLTWHFKKNLAGGGPLFDLSSHAVDLARYLIGEISAVTAVNKTFIKERPLPGQRAATFSSGGEVNSEKGEVEVEDASFMIAEFENGALGSFDSTRFASGRKNYNTFEVYGSKGALTFNFERMNELEFLNLEDPADEQGFKTLQVTNMSQPYAGAWWAPGHVLGYENTFVHAMADFMKAIAQGTQISPNFKDGEKIIQVLEAAELSSNKQQRVNVSDIK